MSDKPTNSNLKRLDAMGEEDIDYSEIPELDAGFFQKARVVASPGMKQLIIRGDDGEAGADLKS